MIAAVLFTLWHALSVKLYVRLKVPFSVNCIFLTFERTCVKILLERFFTRKERNCQFAALYLEFVSYLRKIVQKCTIWFFIVNKYLCLCNFLPIFIFYTIKISLHKRILLQYRLLCNIDIFTTNKFFSKREKKKERERESLQNY